MPDLNLTLYYCIRWYTHIHRNSSVRVLAGIVIAIVRHVRQITYIPKLTLTLCYSVLHGTRVKLTCVAPIASNIKCYVVREILAISERTPSENEPKLTLTLFYCAKWYPILFTLTMYQINAYR